MCGLYKYIPTNEAIKVIKKWGINCDNFVAHNYKQSLYGGDPHDNSQELADYFMGCLKIVTNLGLKSHG